MFFFIAKTLGALAHAPNLIILGVLAGVALLWTRWRRAGRALASVMGCVLALAAFTPIAALGVRPLENRFPQPVLSEPPTGIVVLGGSMNESLSRHRGQPALNEAAERLTEGAALAVRFPTARLVFSGGSARLDAKEATESDVARQLWVSLGLPPERMTFENRSRDTYENASFTKALVQPKPGERWLLVTSAMHMPRSVGIFRKIGFDVIPYPVDYQTGNTRGDLWGLRSPGTALTMLDTLSHEIIGLVAYWATGKSSELYPGP